jgi:cytoskeletal protein CcmA (bactofilin family)
LYRLWIIDPDGKEILRDGRNRTTIDSFRLVRARGSALSRDGNALQSEVASSIGSGLSVVGKIIGNGTLTIFGHVEGEVRAPTIVIAEGAQIEGKVSAEELTVGGYVKGTIDANRVELNSTAVVKGDIFHRTLVIGGSDAGMKSARAIVRWNR